MTEQMEPKLRFKDKNNNDYPDWETKKLHQIIDVKDGTHESPKPTDDGYLLVTSKNLKNSTLDFSESYSISKEDYEDINKRSKVEIGDILFGMIGTIGNPILLEKDGFAIKNVALLKTSSLQEREYILNFLKSNSITKQFYKLNVGGTQKFISLRSIRDLKIDIPSSEEAIKIGGFFSKLDQQIELEEKKLKLLEQQKHGYMQKIFSRELRLKDENGNLSPEWTQTQLKNITNRITRKNKKLESTRPLTISGQLGLIDQVEYFNKSVSSKNLENYTLLQKNEFAYNKSYSNGYPLGAIKRLTRYDKGVLSSLYICFSINSDISVDFMQYYFESTKWFREVASIAVEGARNHGLLNISVNNFFDINIKLPSLENQKKISSFLIKIDNLIEKQSSKVELLKQRKQGLLQKMFV